MLFLGWLWRYPGEQEENKTNSAQWSHEVEEWLVENKLMSLKAHLQVSGEDSVFMRASCLVI